MKTRFVLLLTLAFFCTGCDQYKRMMGIHDAKDPEMQPATPASTPLTFVPEVVPSYHVFIADGQSNMVGGHQEYDFPHMPRFKPNGSSFPYKGPAVGFARSYLARYPDRYVKVVNCSLGGSPITAHQEGGNLFEVCLENVKEFMGPTDSLDGLLWWQGEQDAIDGMSGSQWSSLFSSYLSAMRRRLNKPTLPIVFVQLGVILSTPAPSWDEIKVAQSNLTLTKTEMVKSEDQMLIDLVHYDAASNLVIGNRLFNAFEAQSY